MGDTIKTTWAYSWTVDPYYQINGVNSGWRHSRQKFSPPVKKALAQTAWPNMGESTRHRDIGAWNGHRAWWEKLVRRLDNVFFFVLTNEWSWAWWEEPMKGLDNITLFCTNQWTTMHPLLWAILKTKNPSRYGDFHLDKTTITLFYHYNRNTCISKIESLYQNAL